MAEKFMTPPGIQADLSLPPQAPDEHGSFLVPDEIGHGYETLMQSANHDVKGLSFRPNSSYERYLKMHKVFVGDQGGRELEDIYNGLKAEVMPRYLSTAGWAAVESSLVRTSLPTSKRLALLHGAVDCWQRALQNQDKVNEFGAGHLTEYEYAYRIALDLAILPLLQDVICGDVRASTTKRVFEDCLNIAQANTVRINLMKREGNVQGLGEHVGFGYECNALLAFNRSQSQTWFAIPSMIRSDNGYYHRQQTHDLLVVHQKRGELLSILPVEVKASTNQNDLRRYQALLVRGKLHLSVEGKYRPEETLEAITACYEGTAKPLQRNHVNSISDRFISMIRDYYAGEKLSTLATRSRTTFHDNALVAARHPGLRAA